MTIDWPVLEKLLDSGDAAGLLDATKDLDDKQRRALAKPLQAYFKPWRSLPEPTPDAQHWDRYWKRLGRQAAAVRIAGPLILATPTAAASWLAKSEVWQGDRRITGLLEALRRRSDEFRAELATRLAAAIRPNDWSLAEITVVLVIETGVEPAATAGFVSSWINVVNSRGYVPGNPPQHQNVLAALRADPLTRRVVPLLFEVDGVGWRLEAHDGQPWQTWPGALTALAAEGVLDRSMLLDGCLRRMLRGGRPAELRGYLHLYEALAPTVDEIGARVRDLVRLLPDAPSTTVGTVQEQLRAADEAGRLEFDTALEAARSVLVRTEKKLLTAQLSWLERLATRHPDRVGAVLSTVSVAFGHSAVDIQRRAVSIVEKRLSLVDDAVRREVTDAAVMLPADLRGRLGTPVEDEPAPVAALDVMVSRTDRAMPGPIESGEELAEELNRLFIDPDADPIALERVLAGLVALAAADRAVLRAALAPVVTQASIAPGLPAEHRHIHSRAHLSAIVAAAIGPVRGDLPVMGVSSAKGERRWRVNVQRFAGPDQAVAHRLHEIAGALAHRPVPALVATPTEVTGRLDAEVLLSRLERAALDGWEPLRYDLEQALLRLPRDADPALATRAAGLGTEAGARMAQWLSDGGLAEPVVTRINPLVLRDVRYSAPERVKLALTAVAPAPDGVTVPQAHPPTEVEEGWSPLPESLAALVLDLPAPRGRVGAGWYTIFMDCWPMVLPSHPDVIAAHAVRQAIGENSMVATLLPVLAETGGPVGPSLVLALAYGLSVEHAPHRAAVVDALLMLAARDQAGGEVLGRLDAAALGHEIGGLAAAGTLKLTRAVPALRDAANAGAARQVWDAVAAALPVLFATEKPPNRFADLLVLGFDTAEASGARGEIPELAAFAAGRGSSRTLTEARRLHRLLTG